MQRGPVIVHIGYNMCGNNMSVDICCVLKLLNNNTCYYPYVGIINVSDDTMFESSHSHITYLIIIFIKGSP